MKKQSSHHIPFPFQFNILKHHASYIVEIINHYAAKFDKQKFISNLKTIGESQMDLYLGNYLPLNICTLIEDELISINKYKENDYKTWITKNNQDYKIISLPDKSFWTLRIGKGKKYIHIHPGRYSPFTIRVKASTLKTAIAAIVYSKTNNKEIDLELINYVRRNILDLAPVKSITKNMGIDNLISILSRKQMERS